jgi:DNA replication protein DnaC
VAGVTECTCLKNRIRHGQLFALPSRFRESSFSNYKPIDSVQELALDVIQKQPDMSLFLWGDYGRGKTHLAAAQYRSLVEAGECCLWRSMGELLAELRAAEVRDETSLVLQRVRYADAVHLFIDDIDKFKATEFKQEALFDLFDTLWRRQLSFTITSNLNLAALIDSEKLHPAVISRIDKMCLAVQV